MNLRCVTFPLPTFLAFCVSKAFPTLCLLAFAVVITGVSKNAVAQSQGLAIPLNRLVSFEVVNWRSASSVRASTSPLLNTEDLQALLESFFAHPQFAMSETEVQALGLSKTRPLKLIFNLDGELIVSASASPSHPLLDEARDARLTRLAQSRGGQIRSEVWKWLERQAVRLASKRKQIELGQAAQWDMGAAFDGSFSGSSRSAVRAALRARDQRYGAARRRSHIQGVLMSNATLKAIFGTGPDPDLAGYLPRLFIDADQAEDAEAPSQLFQALESIEWALRVSTSDRGRNELPYRQKEYQRLVGNRWPARQINSSSSEEQTALPSVPLRGQCGSSAFGGH